MSTTKTMNNRERVIRIVKGQSVDRGVAWQERTWNETLVRWRQEGMPENYDFGYDFDDDEASLKCLGINICYYPAWETGLVEDEGETQLVRDDYGIIKRVWKSHTGMPQFVKFPVAGRSDWEDVKKRLDPREPARYPRDWAQRIGRLNSLDYPVSFGGTHMCGFFSLLRELCGDDVYYLFYDDPGLIREILDWQVYRLTTMLKFAAKDVKVDRIFIWEDMCYKNGPLIGPDVFRDFILPPYCRMIEEAKRCGVQVIEVDSDGKCDLLIPLWLEAGVNLLQPMEVTAGMDVVKVKHEYGNKLALRGGVDKRALAQDFAAIDREMERIRPAFEMGGYFPHVDHAVPPNVSFDNFRYYLDKRNELIGRS